MPLLSVNRSSTKNNFSDLLRNEKGAIDLASVMVGVIVIGLIGGVIAATIFAVIPWAQDNAAKQQLNNIVTAESAYIGLATETDAISFGHADDLEEANLFRMGGGDDIRIAKAGMGVSAHYFAYAISDSGNIFFVTDVNTQPTEAPTTIIAELEGTRQVEDADPNTPEVVWVWDNVS